MPPEHHHGGRPDGPGLLLHDVLDVHQRLLACAKPLLVQLPLLEVREEELGRGYKTREKMSY